LCLCLILIIMLQPGKGGDVGLAFGGGGSTIFGPRGPAGLLQRATSVVALLFMVTTITLALYSNRGMMANANVDEERERLQQEEGGAVPAEDAPTDAPANDGAPSLSPATPAPSPVTAPIAPAPAPAPTTP
ncbi:MAG: preprotein translocase subunit SecG, partial [Myxococcota bacterium]